MTVKEKEKPRCPFCERLVIYGPKNVRCSNPHCKFHNGGCLRTSFDKGVVHMFVKFYALYPRKKKPNDSLRAWLKLNPNEKLYKKIMTHVSTSKDHDQQWLDGYIPYPATYINGFRWEDDVVLKKEVIFNQPPQRETTKSKPKSFGAAKAMFEKYREDERKKKGGRSV